MAERTKIWIADTMKKLLSSKSLDKIRVTEICRAAEIERPTFYYHFQDKYDLKRVRGRNESGDVPADSPP